MSSSSETAPATELSSDAVSTLATSVLPTSSASLPEPEQASLPAQPEPETTKKVDWLDETSVEVLGHSETDDDIIFLVNVRPKAKDADAASASVPATRPIVSEEGVVLGEESLAEVQRLLSAGTVNLDDDSDSEASRDPDEKDELADSDDSDQDSFIAPDNDELGKEEDGSDADSEDEDEEMASSDAVTSEDETDSESDGEWKPPPRPKRKAAADASAKISECAQLDAFDTAAAAAVMDEMSRASDKARAAEALAVASVADAVHTRAMAAKKGPKALKAPENEEEWWRAIYRAGNLSEDLVERLVKVRADEASARRAKALNAERKRQAKESKEALREVVTEVVTDGVVKAGCEASPEVLDAVVTKVEEFVGESAPAESVPLQQMAVEEL